VHVALDILGRVLHALKAQRHLFNAL
jgi:hypothetical protein